MVGLTPTTVPSPPHLPRWSKTAAIVVLVVFSLVMVVALFGLLALEGRRDAEAERQHADALHVASHMLDEVHESVRESLSEALRQAASATDPREIWRVLRSERSLTDRMCRYDPSDKAYYWPDDQFLLAMDLRRRDTWALEQRNEVDAANQEAARLDTWRDADPLARVEAWTEHVRDHLVVAKKEEGEKYPFPTVLSHAASMLKAARQLDATNPSPEVQRALRNALLTALTATGLNRTRTDLEPKVQDRWVAEVEAAVTEIHERVPEALPPYVHWEVAQFRALRDLLANPETRRPFEGAIGAALAQERDDRVLLHNVSAEELIAVVPRPGRIRTLTVLQLNFAAIRAYVYATARNPRHALPGFSLRLKSDASGTPVSEKPLADLRKKWNLPLTLVVEETAKGSSATDPFYWLIIALAVVGIAIGGWVLVRLLTRQVRLAELKADFVSNLSHELKTPITSIGLFAEMLRDGKLRSDEDRMEAYEVMTQESDRLQHIVARMLGIARRAASQSPYRKQPGDLNEPVRAAVERFKRLVTDPGLSLEVDLSPRTLSMSLDVAAFEDLVTNLLTNAWKYRRGATAHVGVRTFVRRRRAVLQVIDDGIGIPRSERRRIFQMFYRSEQYLSQGVAGTGLGLALAKTVVKGHHGRIRVLDAPGGSGALFEATFPLAAHDRDVTSEAVPPRSDGQTTVSPNRSNSPRSKQAAEHRRRSGPAAEHS